MKIAFVSDIDPCDRRVWSGTPYGCLQQLKKYHNVDVYTIKNTFFEKIIPAVIKLVLSLVHKNYMTAFSISRSKLIAKRLEKILRSSDCSVIFIIGSHLSAYLKTDKPICYLADANFHQMLDYYWFDLAKYSIFSGNRIQQKSLEKNTINIFTSAWAKKDAVSYYGIDEKKCKVIHLGANIEHVGYQNIKQDNFVINVLFIGVDWNRKGGNIAVDCINLLNLKDPSHHYLLHVVGCNPNLDSSNTNIVIHGFLNKNLNNENEQFRRIVVESDLLLLPTVAECAGMAFCEASAYGLPIFTHDTGGITDYVINEVNGFCLPLGAKANDFAEKIMSFLTDQNKIIEMKKKSIELYEKEYNWDVFGLKLNEIISMINHHN